MHNKLPPNVERLRTVGDTTITSNDYGLLKKWVTGSFTSHTTGDTIPLHGVVIDHRCEKRGNEIAVPVGSWVRLGSDLAPADADWEPRSRLIRGPVNIWFLDAKPISRRTGEPGGIEALVHYL